MVVCPYSMKPLWSWRTSGSLGTVGLLQRSNMLATSRVSTNTRLMPPRERIHRTSVSVAFSSHARIVDPMKTKVWNTKLAFQTEFVEHQRCRSGLKEKAGKGIRKIQLHAHHRDENENDKGEAKKTEKYQYDSRNPKDLNEVSERDLSRHGIQSEGNSNPEVATSTSVKYGLDKDVDMDSDETTRAVAQVEAALHSFFKACLEIFKLAVLLPLRYVVFAPLGWILSRLGLMSVNPNDIINRLESANALAPVEAHKVASALRTLNRHHPNAVVDFVESRGLLIGRQPSSQEETNLNPSLVNKAGNTFAVNEAVVCEYLTALVKTNRIRDYIDDGNGQKGGSNTSKNSLAVSERPITGHRSLALLLEQLRAAAESRPLPGEPGVSSAWPLHVSIQGSSMRIQQSNQPQGLVNLLQRFVGFAFTLFFFTFCWALGAAVVRRYSSGGIGAAPAGIGTSSGAGAMPGLSNNGASSLFAPKEYSKENIPEKSRKTFKDVKGCDEAIMELQEIVAYLKNPEKFTRLGGKLPKGVLLTGPPGAGKTLLARAVAGEAGVPFFYKSGSEFDEMFVGVGSRRVRNLFAAAKKKAPCIVFIDEIDAVGGKRTHWESSGGSRKTLNQLLTDMDGFEENSGVVVMAATNLPELLDAALTRPGRFDRQVAVPLPDVNGRRDILDLYLKDKPLSKDVDAENLARRTPGFSGAQLSNLINEAALLAARYDKTEINAALLDEARDKVLMGSPRALAQTDEARKLTAYHEGGHALVALFTPGAKPIHKATIVPRGHALGMVLQLPDKDEYSTTRQQMMAHIDVCMGGKAAEELIFGEDFVTSGATSDLRSATRLARHMLEDCGMSERIGPVAFGSDVGNESSQLSQESKKIIDEEVGSLLKEAYARVANLLREKESELHCLANALLERETMTLAEIKELLGMDKCTDKCLEASVEVASTNTLESEKDPLGNEASSVSTTSESPTSKA